MLTLKEILKVCPKQKSYILIDHKIDNSESESESESESKSKSKSKSIYDIYINNNNSLSTDFLSTMLNERININEELYRCSLENNDSFIRACLILLANKYNITDIEMFDIRRKLAIEIDSYDVKKSQKSKIYDYLLSSKSVDIYEGINVRKYISLYFDLIVVIFDNKGSILEYYSNVNELTEESLILLLEYSEKEKKYYMILSRKDKLKYKRLDNLFNKLIKWNTSEGELILGLYHKKDMKKCLSKITVTELREICKRYNITLIKKSDKSDKSVKKNKKELYEDLQNVLKL
jgi:hypothetical protein